MFGALVILYMLKFHFQALPFKIVAKGLKGISKMSIKYLIAGVLLAATSIANASLIINPTVNVDEYTSIGEWDNNGNFEGWSVNQVTGASVSGGLLSGSVANNKNDPMLILNSLNLDLDTLMFDILEIRVSRTGPASRFDLFWGTNTNRGASDRRQVAVNNLQSDGQFDVIQFDMSSVTDWDNTLNYIRIDPFSGFANATPARTFNIDYIRVGSITPVPEPTSIAILALGLMGLASRKFKKQ